MILVADSSALVALSICDSLDLLEKLFGDVQVPKAVFDEISISNKPESYELTAFLKGKVKTVDTNNYVYLDGYADAGETEAMLLYKQIDADWLLIDDKRGRKIAAANKIQTIGSLGVLLSAKKKGLIAEIRPKLDMLAKSKLYFSDNLRQAVLDIAEE